MVKAIIFDCFGVLITSRISGFGEVKNQALLDYILELKENYKTAVLSNISSRGIEARFPGNELAQYFDVVIASDDIGVAKPSAQAFHITAEQLGVEPEACIMIDDREEFCEAAKKAGLQAVTYTSFNDLKRNLAHLTR